MQERRVDKNTGAGRQTGLPFGPGRGGPGRHFTVQGRAKDIKGTARRLFDYLREFPQALTAVFLSVAVSTILAVLGPLLLGLAVDSFFNFEGADPLIKILVLMALVYIGYSFTSWLQVFLMVKVSQRSLRNLRKDVFDKLQELSLDYYDSHRHGELMSRITNDVENISNVLTHSVTQLISGVLTTIGVAVMMLILNLPLAAVAILIIPIMGVLTKAVAKRTRQGFRDQQKELGILNGIIEETVTGHKIVKAFGKEDEEILRFTEVNNRLRRASLRAQTAAGILPPMINFVNNFGFAVVAGAGGWLAVSGLATVGTAAAFLNYVRRFSRPVNQLAGLYNTVQSALAGAERVFEVLDTKPLVVDSSDAVFLPKIRGEVVFKDVTFAYKKGQPVLKDIDFSAREGETIALVGPTGAGKTTIVNLLTRFYDVDRGVITIDGYDIRRVKKDTLRRQLGIVLQDTFLFSASVADNIRYGRLDASYEEIKRAACFANADHFIRHLPDGYDTRLSEDGGNLSQGQRQLLSIARAVLAEPSILILDEATSSVDSRTEIHIQEAMLRLMQGRTSFVIAHRLNTIRNADTILVIDGGRIVERGSHRQLINEKGFYYRLHMRQFGDLIGA